jgi:peptide/nickel transport system permease protein
MGDAIGVAAGPTAGYDRGRVDQVIMRLVALNLSFSLILLALAVVAILGPNPRNLIIVTAATTWVIYDRVVRGMTLSPRERDFVRAARSLGASGARPLCRPW